MKGARVFATAWAMLRQRFWLLAGMWVAFFAIQTAASMVLGLAGLAAGTAGFAAGLEDPSAIGGMGIGMIALMVLFYGAYIVILLAQQAAMTVLASPLEEPDFGAAMVRGFRAALPFAAMTLVLGAAYAAMVMAGAALGAAAGPVGAVLGLMMLPVTVWLGCRFAVLIPVVAVERVYSPLAAIRRCWAVTRGRAGAIFLALLALGALVAALFVVPIVLIFWVVLGAQEGGAIAIGAILVGVLLFIPLLIGVTLYLSTFIAALHSELTQGGAEALEEVFA